MKRAAIVSALVATLGLATSVRAQAPATPAPAVNAFADALEEGLRAGDAAVLQRLFDVDLVTRRMIGDERLDAAAEAEARATIADSLANIGAELTTALRAGASYTRLRVRAAPGQGPTVLYRLILPTGAINYHEYLVPGGLASRCTDVYTFTNGEWISQGFRRIWLLIYGARTPNARGRLRGVEGDFAAAATHIGAIDRLRVERRHKEALDAILALPPSVRAVKGLVVLRVAMAQQVGGREFSEAIEAFGKLYPGDPALDLLGVDDHVQRGEFDAALAAIDRIQRAVGGDAALEGNRGNLLLLKGDVRAARAAANAALAVEPALVLPRITLVLAALKGREFAEAASLLTPLVSGNFLSLQVIETHPTYEAFRATPEYAAWRGTLGAGASAGTTSAAARTDPVSDWIESFSRASAAGSDRLLTASMDNLALAETAVAASAVAELASRVGALLDSVNATLASRDRDFAQFAKAGGALRFVRTLPQDGGYPNALFRLDSPGGGFDYVEFRLKPWNGGIAMSSDYYLCSSGEWLSENLGNSWRLAAVGQGMTLQMAFGAASDWREHAARVQELTRLRAEQQNARVIEGILKLPVTLQSDRAIAFLRVMAARDLPGADFDGAVAWYRRLFPDSPSLPLAIATARFNQQRYDEALRAIADVERALKGTDAALTEFRSRALWGKGDRAMARAAASRAVEIEPAFRPAYNTLLGVSLEMKDFEETARVLTLIETQLKQPMASVDTTPAFAEFVRSDAYRRWKESRTSR